MGLLVHETSEITDGRAQVGYFREYIYDNVSTAQPDPKYFELPEACNTAERKVGSEKSKFLYR